MTHSCVFVFFCDFFVHPGHRWRSGDHVSTFLTKVHVLFEAVTSSSQNRTSQIRRVCRHVVFSRDFRNLTKVDTKDSTVVGLCYGDVYCVMKTFVTFTRVCSRLIESCVGLTTSFYTDTLNWLRKYPWPQYGIHKHAHLYDGFCWTLRS
jgi:hypothetical protein